MDHSEALMDATLKLLKTPQPYSAEREAEQMLNKMDIDPSVAANLFEVVALGLADWCERAKVSERDLFPNLAALRRDVLLIK